MPSQEFPCGILEPCTVENLLRGSRPGFEPPGPLQSRGDPVEQPVPCGNKKPGASLRHLAVSADAARANESLTKFVALQAAESTGDSKARCRNVTKSLRTRPHLQPANPLQNLLAL